MMAKKRVVVIGAGPMGLYAALAAARRGFEVTVLERDRIGAALLTWGSARFFSPLSMNIPASLREILPALPGDDALLTGPEMVERVLLPLSRSPLLYDRIRLRHRVLAVGRAGFNRKDYSGHPIRHERPFRILVEGSGGAGTTGGDGNPGGEYTLEADLVLDAAGVYGQANGFGAGGLPVVGERAAVLDGRLLRRLGDLEAFLESLPSPDAGCRVLLIGHGHSAAHALLSLEAASRSREVTVTWSFRSRNRRPVRETADDPLPERDRVVSAANALAAQPPAFLEVRRASSLVSLEKHGTRLRAAFTPGAPGASGGAVAAHIEVDAVAAFTGYRPDASIYPELALDLSPATEGTRGLHAALSGAADCLSLPEVKPRDLESGEPGFHLIGSKSYGRAGTFLLRDGIRQVEMILDAA
jgi:threonine dehydrogenase-like Zn-dependent dehydrogenase